MSKIEVDAIDKQSGSTLTLGGSGTAVTLACGATQTGFGRTGTVDWQTSSIKTATFTAANGEGYFANTSGGAFTMNLPAGSAGSIVSVADYADFSLNPLTISPNGSDKLAGNTGNAALNTQGQSVTLVFVDSTKGWITVNDSEENVTLNPFMSASGGTITNCGNDRIHTFTGPGTFTVNNVASCAANNAVSHLVVAGGGGGGTMGGGGGGAGGLRETKSPITPYTASPIAGGTPITVTAQAYPITVGGGGSPAAGSSPNVGSTGGNGTPSIFSIVTSTAGGGGGSRTGSGSIPDYAGNAGGSGGGAGRDSGPPDKGGAGNTPPVSPAQGFKGGYSTSCGASAGGGGGGASAVGGNGGPNDSAGPGSCGAAGAGGAGVSTSITGSPVTRAGGGGGGSNNANPPLKGIGGAGGGGNGGQDGSDGGSSADATDGTTNTGSGGGGGSQEEDGSSPSRGGAGGSGIVIIRYKFQ